MIQSLQPIGDASGIMLPPALLQACGIRERVEVEVRDGTIVLRAVESAPRAGWDDAFIRAHAAGAEPEGDLFAGMANEFDATDWTWEEAAPDASPDPIR